MSHDPTPDDTAPLSEDARAFRGSVLVVALLNLGWFVVEGIVALGIGSVSLLADSVDFFEDFAVNTLVFLALGWTLVRRARAGKVLAGIILLPAVATLVEAVGKGGHPGAPAVLPLVVTAALAAVVNAVCTVVLARGREHGGSLGSAAYLAARNDVLVNLGIIVVGLVTRWWRSGWPDLAFGVAVALVNGAAAKEVWELARDEHLAARALAGEDLDD